MSQATLRKGNLYNPLTQSIDNLLLDSDQYDLEVSIDGETRYYRVRYVESFFEAEEITPKNFVIHRYNKSPILPEEAKSFMKTKLFREGIKGKSQFPKMKSPETEPFYAHLQRKKGRNFINHSSLAYSFTLPSLGTREKGDVSYYEIEIELANNRYYVIFMKERVNEFGLQRENPLYMIYEKKDFNKMKAMVDEAVLDIAIREDYPLNLLQYVYIATGGDYSLISRFFHSLETAKSIEGLLIDPFIRKIISKNEEIREELIKYLNGEQDDINYSFQKKQ